MAKQSGINERLYVAEFDLSGDVGALNTVRAGRNLMDVTGLNKSAVERLRLLRDGEIDFTAFFDAAAGAEYPVLKNRGGTQTLVTWCTGVVSGTPTGSLIGRQSTFDHNRGADGSLVITSNFMGDSTGLEWGELVTSAAQDFASAAASTGADLGTTGLAVSITSSSVANPTHIITATAHGMVTGDSVTIAGHSGSSPSINGSYTIIRVSDTEYTIPVNVATGGTGGTSTKTSTDFGLAAYLHVLSLASGTATVTLQDSADNSSYANLTGGAFTAITAATSQRITTAITAITRRYVRVNVTGTFSHLIATVAVARYVNSPLT